MTAKRAKPFGMGQGIRVDEAPSVTLTRLRSEIVAGCAIEVAELVGAWLAYQEAGDIVNGARVLIELQQSYRVYVDASLSKYDRIMREDLTRP